MLVLYLAVVSAVMREILYASFIAALLVIALDEYVDFGFRNLACLIIALSPFIPVLSLFIFYLPFAVYGSILNTKSFAKKYLFGFSMSFFPAVILYTASQLAKIKISIPVLLMAFYLPVALAFYRLISRNGLKPALELYIVDFREFASILLSLLFMFLVAHSIVNNSSMYVSNGTYVYTKFLSVADGISKFNEIPQYEPRIGEGEQLFLTDTPLFYSNLAFAKLVLFWVQPVLFYNSMTFFIIWLSVLGAFLLVRELISRNDSNDSMFVMALSMVAGLAIVISFTYLQLFESFKQASSFPQDFLALSMIFAIPKSPSQFFGVIAVLMVSFMIHPTKATGSILIALFSMLLLALQGNFRLLRDALGYAKKNKAKILCAAFIFTLIPLFYLFPSYYYRNFARDAQFLSFSGEMSSAKSYVTQFFLDSNTNPLSVKYPDLRRVDDKKFGFFFSFFGIISAIFVVLNFRKPSFGNAAVFTTAYVLHFIASSFIAGIPPYSAAEYNYRSVLPFLLVVLVAMIAAAIANVRRNAARYALALVFLGAFLHSSWYSSQNLANIHSESIIAGETFRSEIEFFRQLPVDGRIITFGMYSNAVDTAMSALTDRYFSRYGYLQWDFTGNTYEKLTQMNSFGTLDAINPLTGNEIASYLRLTGYKYVFLNICHPVGIAVLQKLYPGNSYPMYQNPENKCNVVLGINNSNYAEKVDVASLVDEQKYNEPNGYWYVTFNTYKKIHNFNLAPYMKYTSEKPMEPEPLKFERFSPTNVRIYGNFNNNEWVVFKEEYFSRWHAYMNGNEVPLLATNNRMMLIKTIKGSAIELKYFPNQPEKIYSLLSLAGALALVLVFALM